MADFFDGVAKVAERAQRAEDSVRATFEIDITGDRQAPMGRFAYKHSQFRIFSAADHLKAWASDIEANQSVRVFASASLIRGALEAAVVAHWILEPEAANIRRARGARAQYESLTQEATASQAVIDFPASKADEALERFKTNYNKEFRTSESRKKPPSLNVSDMFDECLHLNQNQHLVELGYESRFLWNYFSGTTHHHDWAFHTTFETGTSRGNVQPDNDLLRIGAEAALQVTECAARHFVHWYASPN